MIAYTVPLPTCLQVICLFSKIALILSDGFILQDVPKLQALVIGLAMVVQLAATLRWVGGLFRPSKCQSAIAGSEMQHIGFAPSPHDPLLFLRAATARRSPTLTPK